MIDLANVKTILVIAGITQLTIWFDDKCKLVNADYVFKGTPGKKQITYEQIIESLTIGHDLTKRLPTGPICPAKDSDR